MMIVTGGTFGVNGGARFGPADSLEIRAARAARFHADDITSVVASTANSKAFSVASFLLLALLLSLLLGLLLSVFGVVIALVVAIACSYRTRTQHIVNMEFINGDRVTLRCDAGEVDRLIRLKHFTPQA